VLAGDVDAYEELVRRWQRPLFRLAWRFVRDEPLAEEMVQEAFIRAYRALPAWRGESAFSTWLFAIAANVYRTFLRRLRAPAEPLADIASDADPSHELEAGRRDAAVRRAVASLPALYREAVVHFYFQEQGVEETAAILGIPPGTLKARLHRARKLLAAKLERMVAR